MARVMKVSTDDFAREVIHSHLPVVVDVYADWCGPCRALAPLLDRLATHFAGRIKFAKVNIDEDPEVADVYRVKGVPTLLLFANGHLVDRVVGLADPRRLLTQLERLASAPVGAWA